MYVRLGFICDLVEDKIEEFNRRLKELEDNIKGGVVSGEGGKTDIDMNLLRDMVKKSEMEDLVKRLEKCEKKSKKASQKAKKQEKKQKKWKPKWV